MTRATLLLVATLVAACRARTPVYEYEPPVTTVNGGIAAEGGDAASPAAAPPGATPSVTTGATPSAPVPEAATATTTTTVPPRPRVWQRAAPW